MVYGMTRGCKCHRKRRSPAIHFHVLRIEEEEGGRQQSDVEVVEIGLQGWRSSVHQEHHREFGDISCRLRKLDDKRMDQPNAIGMPRGDGSKSDIHTDTAIQKNICSNDMASTRQGSQNSTQQIA